MLKLWKAWAPRRLIRTSAPFPELKALECDDYNSAMDLLRSDEHNEAFWSQVARRRIQWYQEPEITRDTDLIIGKNRWFIDGKLNVADNCIERHFAKNPDKAAVIWESDSQQESSTWTYKSIGTCKGDRVLIYMPQTPYVICAMLACAKIGAVHTVVFAGFSAESLARRITDSGASVAITADQLVRAGKTINLKETLDKALEKCPPDQLRHVLVQRRTKNPNVTFTSRDLCLDRAESEVMDSEDALFILYTSGTTGSPKGLVHTVGGYLTYVTFTHQQAFNFDPAEDIFGCFADVAWITGHSYLVYGPLSNGGTTVIFESTPLFPDPGRYWATVERHRLTHTYLSPTALRILIRYGDHWPEKYDLSSLKCLGSVGEPLNIEAWEWYKRVIGRNRCDVVDTWWQTETGGIVLSPRPSAEKAPITPGRAMQPLPGISACVVNDEGELAEPGDGDSPVEGALCLRTAWPGMAASIWGDHERFLETYFKPVPGNFYTGDRARIYNDGCIQITGRNDDVINICGHRIGTAEIEDALDRDHRVAEAAAVGFKHPIKGEAVYAFVTLKESEDDTPHAVVREELRASVRKNIAAYAIPDRIQISRDGLPKTRSGKIMRRILQNIAEEKFDDLGDVSTLADPGIVRKLVDQHFELISQEKTQ